MINESFLPYIPRPKIKENTYLCQCGNKTHDPSYICAPCRIVKEVGYGWDEIK